MRKLLTLALAALLCLAPLSVDAKGGHSGTHHGGTHASTLAQRDDHGHIKRSSAAKHEFEKQNPCPSTGETHGACPGYVIDHMQPLKRGGADDPSNMQWQTKADAKAKDKWE